MRFVRCACLCLLTLIAVPAAALPAVALNGVVVEEVAPGSTLEKAGLRAGDILESWERPPSPPANPEPAQGLLSSPFDWMWLEVEQAHRGLVVLNGYRNGQRRAWYVSLGEWNVHFNSEPRGRSRVRPAFSSPYAALYEKGRLQIRRRRLQDGVSTWVQLSGEIPQEQEDPLRSWLLLRVGEIWANGGDWKRAHQAFQEAAHSGRNGRTRVFLWEAVGKSLEYQGLFKKAEDSYRMALGIREAIEPDSLGVARSVHQIASQEWNLGNLNKAKAGFDQALALRTRWAPGSFLEADSLHSQGFIALDRSDLEGAEYFLKRAVAIQERFAPDSFWMAFKLEGLGNVYALRGDLDVATHHFERALRIRERLVPNGESVALALIRLGRLKLDHGRWKEGQDLFEQALAILQRVFPRHPMVAGVFNSLGDAALAAGELGRAEAFYRQALNLLADVAPDHPWSAQSLNGLADVEYRRGNWKIALADRERALAVCRRVGSGTDGEARTLAGMGRIAWHEGELDQASSRLQEAIQVLEAQVGRLGGSEDVKADFRALRRGVYFDAAEVELELGRTERAFDIQEAARAQGFLSLLATRDLRASEGIPPELEAERRRVSRLFRKTLSSINSMSAPREPGSLEKASRELSVLREQLDSISEQIRLLSPHATTFFPKPLRLEEVARELDSDMQIVAYQVGETATHVFVLSRDGRVEAFKLPTGAGEIQRDVERFRAAMENRLLDGGQATLEPLQRLYRSLLKPVEPLLNGAGRLLILPDGPLHAVPWAALVRDLETSGSKEGRSWQFLVEWKPFSVALSATVWAELKSSRGRLTSSRPMAAFGDPVFRPALESTPSSLAEARLKGSVHRGLDPSPLPFSRLEVESIAQLFPGQFSLFLGSEATEERVKGLSRDTRIVHFATHGFADERLPMNSGLLLTAPDRRDEGAEDGFLQAWEIFESVRLDADLVVLSACDSGRGKELGGEGLLSLTRAFQFAGARAVIASLWKVADKGSADLMVRFYRKLKNGSPIADALREAQIEAIAGIPWIQSTPGKRTEANLSNEMAWAAFEVFGDWQ
jgi:CHAT domain-containing protein/Tfp pilus assembly protein PilF